MEGQHDVYVEESCRITNVENHTRWHAQQKVMTLAVHHGSLGGTPFALVEPYPWAIISSFIGSGE